MFILKWARMTTSDSHWLPQSPLALQWRHNGLDDVSNHQPQHCLLNRLFRCRSKKTSKLPVTGICAENSPGTGEFPAQMASNAEKMFPSDYVIMCDLYIFPLNSTWNIIFFAYMYKLEFWMQRWYCEPAIFCYHFSQNYVLQGPYHQYIPKFKVIPFQSIGHVITYSFWD